MSSSNGSDNSNGFDNGNGNTNGSEANNRLSAKQEAHFEKMLPWLLNGTLSEAERVELEEALAHSKKLRDEKQILMLLQQQVKQQQLPDIPLEFAWHKMKRQIAEQKTQQSKQQPKNTANKNSEKKWRYMAIAASALLIIQSSSLLVSWKPDDRFQPLSGSSVNNRTNAALFTVQFVDTATALEIQQLLKEYQLSVISGPSSIGLYRVSGQTDSIENAEKILAQLTSHSEVIAYLQQDE